MSTFQHSPKKIGFAVALPLLLGACSTPSSAPKFPAAEHADDLIRSQYAPGELTFLCHKAMDEALGRYDAIAHLAPAQRTTQNTLLAFETTGADLTDATQPLNFMKYVSTDTKTHSEGALCEKETGDFNVKVMGRRDLYNAIKSVQTQNSDEARLKAKTIEAFEASGLKLPDDRLAQVTQMMGRLNELQNHFSENLNNDATTLELTPDELKGVSADFLSRLKKSADGSHLIVTTKITDYLQVMENVGNPETRKKMAIAYNSRQAQANTELLEQALQVRAEIAHLMGYKTWADYQLSHGRMAKNAQDVLDFIRGLKDKLAKRNRKDVEQLLAFKKTYAPKATHVDSWDVPYLAYQLQKRDYSLDDDQIREYFPSDAVVQSMFKVYSQLLGVRFEQVTDAHSWSPDVRLYRILDASDGHLIGHFFTDFVPRPGKYEHFAAFPLISARALPTGYDKPVSAIVGNFNPPTNGKPSLLNHEEVVTLFHEFGHIMHQTLSRAPYQSLAGSSVVRDFVEAPSQMLENWTWEADILNQLSGHYQNPSRKLPAKLLKKMIAVRDFQQGYFYTRQLMLASLDMTYHTQAGPVDTAATYDKLYQELLGIQPVPGGHFAAGFGHLMGGYDAGYYGYLWSLVYATDMFTAFKGKHLLDPKVGERYRKEVLERGDMEDADVLLKKFLGRPANNQAFFKKLHIQ